MSPDLERAFTRTAQQEGITRLVVAAVIVERLQVLIVRRRRDDFLGGLWELPSGAVDIGESLQAALRREVQEETGLVLTGTPQYLGGFDYETRAGMQTRQFSFLVDAVSPRNVHLTEHDRMQWVALESVPSIPVTTEIQTVPERVQEGLS